MEQYKIIEFFNEYLTIDTIGNSQGKSTYSELFDFLMKSDIEIGDVLLPFNNPDALDCLKYANDELNPHNCFLNFCINTYEWSDYDKSLNGKKVKPPTINEQIRESATQLVKAYKEFDNATSEQDKDSARLMIDLYAGQIKDAKELMNNNSYIHHGLAKVLKHFGDWNANLKYGGSDAIPWQVAFANEQEKEIKKMTGSELYKLVSSHYSDFKKMADEGDEFMKYIYDFKDADDYALNGFFDKSYLSYEKKMMKYGDELYKKYIKTKDEKFKKLRSMYAHSFIGAMWKAQSIIAKLNEAIKNKDAKKFCDVMACQGDETDKYFAMIARVDNWIRLNEKD